MRLQDKVAIVTGAGSASVRASRTVRREGAKVLVADIDRGHAERVADARSASRPRGHRRRGQRRRLPADGQETIEAFGRLDIVVNNAGITHRTSRCSRSTRRRTIVA